MNESRRRHKATPAAPVGKRNEQILPPDRGSDVDLPALSQLDPGLAASLVVIVARAGRDGEASIVVRSDRLAEARAHFRRCAP
jgi:hypothetical protein